MKDRQAHWLAALSVVISSVIIFTFFGVSKEEFVSLAVNQKVTATFAGVGLYDELEVLAEDKRAEIEAELKQYLRIYLPDGIEESNIKMETDYVKHGLNIEISGADEAYLKSQPIVGSCNHIAEVNYWFEGGKAYFDLKLDSVYEYEASYTENQLIVKFLKPKEVYDKVIVVDAGHGGSHPGTNRNGILEKDMTLDIVLYLKELLDKSDIRVYYTRVDDTNPSFEERSQLANSAEADFFVSVHINADDKSRSSNGTEALYFTQDIRSKEFAQLCVDELSTALGSRNRGVSNGDSIYIVRTSKVPVTLLEVGFISNNEEFNLLCSDSYKKKAAQGIYNGIMKAYEEKQGE